MALDYVASIVELLGGKGALKADIHQEFDLISIVRAGIPAVSIRSLANKTHTPIGLVGEIVQIDKSTLMRRLRENRRLKPDESDRVLRFARAFALAKSALGDGAHAWINTENRALGGVKPIELLDTEAGAREVENVLGRIEHGVFSQLRVYRILERKHLATAFTGEGASLYGGRWNSPGVRMVYAASSLPLAILEMLVNGTSLPPDVAYVTVDLPDPSRIDTKLLPLNWNVTPAPIALRALGDDWIRSGSSVALAVPSALTPIDDNVLLNPDHAGFNGLVIGSPAEIKLDPPLGR